MADSIKQRVIIRKKDRGEYILNGLCNYWDISRHDLLKPAIIPPSHHGRGNRYSPLKKRKYLAVYMLYYIADFQYKDIADVLGYSPKTMYHMTAMRDYIADLLSDNGDALLKKEYSQILKYLQL